MIAAALPAKFFDVYLYRVMHHIKWYMQQQEPPRPFTLKRAIGGADLLRTNKKEHKA